MAYPLYAYEERYWQPIDPYLARLVRAAFCRRDAPRSLRSRAAADPAAKDPGQRSRIAAQCRQARTALREVFDYYVRVFVGLFDAVARRHCDLFADAELSPGRRIADTPYADQVAHILHCIDTEHSQL